MISANLITYSQNEETGQRIATYILTYPRFIHSEFMTHRVFSRNAASSRAIPIQKMINDVLDNTAFPVKWGKNQKGMQSYEDLPEYSQKLARAEWIRACIDAVKHAERLAEIGVHKQIANRVLEPFVMMRTLCTATDWDNFFALRYHHAADPNIKVLADVMLHEFVTKKPKILKLGKWHVPFGDRMPESVLDHNKLKVATARAARLSYLTFDGVIDPQKDIQLHDDLLKDGHFSPFEHCAIATQGRFGNFNDWRPYRKTFSSELEIRSFDYEKYCIEKGIPSIKETL